MSEFLPATGGRLGGRAPGRGTGGRRFTGGGFMRGGGGGRPGGGGGGSTPGIGGGWKGSMLGKLTSSTTTGSLPWSKGHMSPLMQKPFSRKEKQKPADQTCRTTKITKLLMGKISISFPHHHSHDTASSVGEAAPY